MRSEGVHESNSTCADYVGFCCLNLKVEAHSKCMLLDIEGMC